MLGHSNAGKTTYMASMYSIMNARHQSKRGFGVVTTNDGDHHTLLKLGNRIAHQGDYPSATDVRTEYAFSLTLNGKTVLPFKWVDYRGGALYDRSDDSTSDLDMLTDDLCNSDAVLVFMDAPTLVDESGEDPLDIGRLTAILGNIANVTLPPPVALVISKSDALLPPPEELPSTGPAFVFFGATLLLTLITIVKTIPIVFFGVICCGMASLLSFRYRSRVIAEQRARRQTALQALLKRATFPLEGLITVISNNPELQGGMIPIGCSSCEMINVEKPVLFSLYYGVSVRLKRLQLLILELEERARHHEAKSSLLDSFASWWRSETSNAEHARKARAEAASEQRQFQALIPPAQALQPSIRDIIIF